MHIFSKELIEKTIKTFYEEDGLALSPETANRYLQSMSNLFLAFSKQSKINDNN